MAAELAVLPGTGVAVPMEQEANRERAEAFDSLFGHGDDRSLAGPEDLHRNRKLGGRGIVAVLHAGGEDPGIALASLEVGDHVELVVGHRQAIGADDVEVALESLAFEEGGERVIAVRLFGCEWCWQSSGCDDCGENGGTERTKEKVRHRRVSSLIWLAKLSACTPRQARLCRARGALRQNGPMMTPLDPIGARTSGQPERCLVTGGGGFLGGAVVRELRARGHDVRSFSRRKYPDLERQGVEQHVGDLADREAVTAAVSGCSRVFHVAAKAGAWGPWEGYFRTNIEGTRNVIDACLAAGVPALIHTSTPSVVFDGRDIEGRAEHELELPRHYEAHYPRSKAVAERAVLEANCATLQTVALRPHLIWGPGDTQLLPRMIERARAGRLRRIGGPEKKIAPTFIDDAARAHVLASEALVAAADHHQPPCGRAYFVTSGECIAPFEMVDSMLRAANAGTSKPAVPQPVARTAAAACELLWLATGRSDEPPLTRWVVDELTTSHWFDLGAAERDFGYRPEVSIEEGLARLARDQAGNNEAAAR